MIRYSVRRTLSLAFLSSNATSIALSMTCHSRGCSNLPLEIDAVMLTPSTCLPVRGVEGFVRSYKRSQGVILVSKDPQERDSALTYLCVTDGFYGANVFPRVTDDLL